MAVVLGVVRGWKVDEAVDKLVLGVEIGALLEDEVVAGSACEVEDVALGGACCGLVSKDKRAFLLLGAAKGRERGEGN